MGSHISDEVLLTQARMLGERSGAQGFKGTNGWLEGFKSRHCIRSKVLHGEAAAADQEGVSLSQRNLPALISEGGYAKEDVYNFDETGLFYKAEPKRTLVRVVRCASFNAV